MSIDCPACKHETEDDDVSSDYLIDMRNNQFEFECECGALFVVHVDFSPEFYVEASTLKMKDTK